MPPKYSLQCVWPWGDGLCPHPPRSRFSVLCVFHVTELNAVWRKLRHQRKKESQVMAQTVIDHRGMDRILGDVDRFPELAAIVGAIFAKVRFFSLPEGTRCRTKIMASGECFAVDHNGRRYIEQNRATNSPESERARDGAQIVWVIQTHDDRTGHPLPTNRWLGKIEDGIVRMR
jgi:hypothetical protein